MKKETTTFNWNYTLPNLLDYLEYLASQAAKNQSDLEIISRLNSSLFVLRNFSDTPLTPHMGSHLTTSPAPVNKPFFMFNFSFKSLTMSPLRHVYPVQLNASGFQLLSGYESSSYDSLPSDGLDGSSSTNFLMNINDSFGSIDDAWWLSANDSSNATGIPSNHTNHEALTELVSMIVTSTILGIMILTTVIGNVFVIAAILLERNLQQVANFLIVSLAVADLMVACLVMPLGAVYEISNEWALGPELCDMWTSSDVLCCTASILHLVAIALDRYWAVTHVDYIHSRNGKRIGIMIFFIWMTAIVVSIAPLFGWKDPDFNFRVKEQKKCLISQDMAYQIFATMATFYVPLTAILILYWKIFQTARKRIHKRPGKNEIAQHMLKKVNKKRKSLKKAPKTNGIPKEETTAFTTEASGNMGITMDNLEAAPDTVALTSDQTSNNGAALSVTSHTSKTETLPKEESDKKEVHKKTKKETLEAKREKKAAKTLAIITGAFVVCWLPFFVNVLVMSLCPNCWMSDLIFSIFLWLGYFNSTLNPIIYTIFSPEFRQAFKRILCGKKNQRYRPGKMN